MKLLLKPNNHLIWGSTMFSGRCSKLLLRFIFIMLKQNFRINKSQPFYSWVFSLLMTHLLCPTMFPFSTLFPCSPAQDHSLLSTFLSPVLAGSRKSTAAKPLKLQFSKITSQFWHKCSVKCIRWGLPAWALCCSSLAMLLSSYRWHAKSLAEVNCRSPKTA